MPAPNFEIEIKDKGIQDLLSRIERRVNRLKPAMGLIGEIALGSIQENFEKGGRPSWKPLSQTTINLRKKINKWPGRILVRSGVAGGLMGGITYRPSDVDVKLAANKPYATTQHFGAKKGSFGTIAITIKEHTRTITQAFGKELKEPKDVKVKAHTRKTALPWGDIPARPFMMVQDEDWEEIKDTLVEFLLSKDGENRN